jgi:hypothetical protein
VTVTTGTTSSLPLVGRAFLLGEPEGSLEEKGGVRGANEWSGVWCFAPPFRSNGLGRFAPCDRKTESPPHKEEGEKRSNGAGGIA